MTQGNHFSLLKNERICCGDTTGVVDGELNERKKKYNPNYPLVEFCHVGLYGGRGFNNVKRKKLYDSG